MSTAKYDLPQEWPEHLAHAAAISPIRTSRPIGEPVLDFTAMHYTTFEQFCWWLLAKDGTLAGCARLGGNGMAQGGIDIFAFDADQTDKLNVFECKAWKDFKPLELSKAIDTFLKGDWAKSTNKFTIILAQQVAGPSLLQQWQEERLRLRKAGIEGELWTAENLTLKVQPYPDILSKFFPSVSIETHANIWMERSAFHELASKAFFDPRERVARWARELVGRSNGDHSTSLTPGFLNQTMHEKADARKSFLAVDGTYRQVNQIGNSLHFKGPWFSLSAILPSQRFSHASAAFTFNRPDMQGVTLTVDHKWLLTRFLFREGAPLVSQYRGFIAGPMPHSENQHIVDFPHCRLTLQHDGVEEIAGVADLLTDAMRNSLNTLETAWSAVNFPFVTQGSRKVALAAIRADVWQEIGLFAEEHDVSNGTTPWHMFDGNRYMLKPYHETANENFDAGYHGVIHATQIDGLSRGDEVVLLWQPNDLLPNQALSPRGWWSCEFAFQWLNDTLLPEVKRHVHERCFGRPWKRIFRSRDDDALATRLDEMFVARDLRQRPLLHGGNWSANILESVEVLQSFFNTVEPGAPEPYIRRCEMENLYRSVAIIARYNRGYVGYARSKLGLPSSPADHADLIRMIDDYIHEGHVIPCCGVADNVFRSMHEMLDGSDAWLCDSDREAIKDYMAPFARLRDDATLIYRHMKWN